MMISNEIIAFTTICIIFNLSKQKNIEIICLSLLVVLILVHIIKKRGHTFKLHILDTDGMNEVLIMDTMIGSRSFLFLLDTGYAGPPVLSRSYLSIQDPVHLSLKDRYNKIIESLHNVTDIDEHEGINSYINNGQCFPYTSGCTMKLMGIGSVQEQQADMLMCPMLRIKNSRGGFQSPKSMTNTHADVFVTNKLKHSIHILTCDFLLHHSPCLISISTQTLSLNLNISDYMKNYMLYKWIPASFSGGSFVVPFILEDGQSLNCTVDTGAPGPICLGSNAIKKIRSCQNTQKKLQQQGVNGEIICSEIIDVDVTFAGSKYNTTVFVNDMPTDQTDGYVGMGFLRAFDIFITHHEIGFRKNNNRINKDFGAISKSGNCNLNLNCEKPT